MRAHVSAFERNSQNLVTRGRTFGLGQASRRTPLSRFAQALGAEGVAKVTEDRVKWEGSPFADIRFSWSQTKGTLIGESIGRAILETAGETVSSAFVVREGLEQAASSYDLYTTGLNRVEVKLATEGIAGTFSWGGIEPTLADQFLLLGVCPKYIRGWLIPGAEFNRLLGMKSTGTTIRGISHNARTGFSITARSGSEHHWMTPYGGTEDALLERIKGESTTS